MRKSDRRSGSSEIAKDDQSAEQTEPSQSTRLIETKGTSCSHGSSSEHQTATASADSQREHPIGESARRKSLFLPSRSRSSFAG